MTSKKIVITGGSGFIGINAVEYYRRMNWSVLNIDIRKPRNVAHADRWVECDILDLKQYQQVAQEFDPDYFLHLAARTDLHEKRTIDGYAANTLGVQNTIRAANACRNLKRIVFASSRMVCKIGYQPKHDSDYCPPNLYGKSKVIGEQYVKENKLTSEWTIVRPTSIWGPWFDVPYRNFFDMIQKGLYFNPGGVDPLKSFGFVENTIYQLHQLLNARSEFVTGRVFYVCDYPPLRLSEWSELIRRQMRKKPIPTIPFWMLKSAAFIGDTLSLFGFRNAPLSSFRLNNLVTTMVHDTRDLEQICGTLPYSLEEGVRKTVKWLTRIED